MHIDVHGPWPDSRQPPNTHRPPTATASYPSTWITQIQHREHCLRRSRESPSPPLPSVGITARLARKPPSFRIPFPSLALPLRSSFGADTRPSYDRAAEWAPADRPHAMIRPVPGPWRCTGAHRLWSMGDGPCYGMAGLCRGGARPGTRCVAVAGGWRVAIGDPINLNDQFRPQKASHHPGIANPSKECSPDTPPRGCPRDCL